MGSPNPFRWLPDLGGIEPKFQGRGGFVVPCSTPDCREVLLVRAPCDLPLEPLITRAGLSDFRVNSNGSKVVCPACRFSRRLIRLDEKTRAGKVVATAYGAIVSPRPTPKPERPAMSVIPMNPAPVAATPEERRQVLEAIQRAHDGTRYAGRESDASLSERLGVPRALVAQLREDFLGGPDENEETQKSRLTVAELAERLEAAKAEVKAAEELLLERMIAVNRTIVEIENKLGRLERHLAPKSARGAK